MANLRDLISIVCDTRSRRTAQQHTTIGLKYMKHLCMCVFCFFYVFMRVYVDDHIVFFSIILRWTLGGYAI